MTLCLGSAAQQIRVRVDVMIAPAKWAMAWSSLPLATAHTEPAAQEKMVEAHHGASRLVLLDAPFIDNVVGDLSSRIIMKVSCARLGWPRSLLLRVRQCDERNNNGPSAMAVFTSFVRYCDDQQLVQK